jgi:hypothetical protein
MGPGQVTLNDFELAILKRIAEQRPEMVSLIPKLRVLSRKFTGVGCYTEFDIEEAVPSLGNDRISMNGHITMPGIQMGMDAILFCEKGKPDTLETYTCGAEMWEGVHEGFSIGKTA